MLFLVCAALYGLNASFQMPVRVPDRSRNMIFSGVVISEDHRQNGVKLTVDLKRAMLGTGSVSFPLTVDIYCRSRRTQLGRSLLIKGKLGPSYSTYGRNSFTGEIIGEEKDVFNPVHRILFKAREHIDNLFRKTLPDRSYDLASGLILGGSGRVGSEMQTVFTRAGVLHILSVSGLHVGFLIGFITLCLVFIPLSPKIKFLITAVLLFLYAGITGFLPTVLRAGLMGLLFGWALIRERNVDGIHIVNITALALLAISPLILFDLGAQLSFVSIYGIVFLFPKLKSLIIDRIRIRPIKSLATLMGISASAQIYVTPFLIYYFQRIQTLAIFSNLLVVPLSSVITYLLFSMIIISLWNLSLARMIGLGVVFLLKVLVSVSRFFAGLPGAAPDLSIPFPFLALFYFLFTPRWRKCAIRVIMITAVFLTISSLPKNSILILVQDEARLVLPDQTTLIITDHTKPDRMISREVEITDYLIAPVQLMPVRKGYFKLPDDLSFKKFHIGDWTVDVRKKTTFIYRDRRWILNDSILGSNKILYVIAHGRRIFQFTTQKYGSLFNRCVTEFKIIYIKLRLLTI